MKKKFLEKFKSSILTQDRLKSILGGYGDVASTTVNCPGGSTITCTGASCESSATDYWCKCDSNPKTYCLVM